MWETFEHILKKYFSKTFKNSLTYCNKYDIIYTEKRKGGYRMDNIEKALQNLAEALKSNDSVARVKITITLVKPKPDKAKPESK